MGLRAATPLVVLLLASPVLRGQTAPPPIASTNAAAATTLPAITKNTAPASTDAPKDPSPKSRVLFFYTAPRSSVEMEVHTVPPTDAARLDRLRAAFQAADCGGPHMQEQPVASKHGGTGTNLICTWPGESNAGTIVVAAHYERDGKGEGALADWSGAALLPFLYQAIQGQARENNFVFLESWKSAGVETWLKSLSREQRKNIRAMIDVDALGLGVTRYFTTFSFMETTPPAALHMQAQLLWAAIDDGFNDPPKPTNPHHWLSVDNTDAFRAMMIPTIVIHSVPPESEHIPGSAADTAASVDGNAYFQSYHLLCTYLASLDHMARRLALNDPYWNVVPGQDIRPQDETPQVTFRNIQRGRLAPPGH
ncbi:MAG TPA: M28 family peptidase [Acidobacteriaceae bacterium]